mmetsp:Transcript_4056/g.9220  ORF Transcript_4056/g.9220 Transcript_4056/m.9220 type:complete len:103 (+) Transcript_4056:454-762(+)
MATSTDCDPVEISQDYCHYLTNGFTSKKLGEGSFGSVFCGRDPSLKSHIQFVVKRIRIDLSGESALGFAKRTFDREINVSESPSLSAHTTHAHKHHILSADN